MANDTFRANEQIKCVDHTTERSESGSGLMDEYLTDGMDGKALPVGRGASSTAEQYLPGLELADSTAVPVDIRSVPGATLVGADHLRRPPTTAEMTDRSVSSTAEAMERREPRVYVQERRPQNDPLDNSSPSPSPPPGGTNISVWDLMYRPNSNITSSDGRPIERQ